MFKNGLPFSPIYWEGKKVNSPIVRLIIPVSSICMIWVFPIHYTSVKKITESSVLFLRNGVLILNGKENKEATAICFEIRIPKKKNKELLWKVPSKMYGSNFIMEKTKIFFGLSIIPNIITEKWGYCEKNPWEQAKKKFQFT